MAELSLEERKRRSEVAKRNVAEGKIGGPNRGQGRKKKVRANEKIANDAARHAQKIMDGLIDIIDNSKKPMEVMAAMKMILEIEEKEMIRENKTKKDEFEGKSKNEVIEFLVEKLLEKQDALPKADNSNVIDSTATEI